MTNLNKFKNYNIYGKTEEVMEHISFIEELMRLKEYDYVPLEGRKILEAILLQDYKSGTLHTAIRDFGLKNNIPETIKKSMMFIKEKGNEAAHSLSKFEKSYGVETDIYSAIEISKNLFIILRYFVELTSDFSIDISGIKFGGEEYEHALLAPSKIKKDNFVKNNEDMLKTLLKAIGKTAFIKCYQRIDDPNLIEDIMAEDGLTIASAKTKVNGTKSIIKKGWAKEALRIISMSKVLDIEITSCAKKLFDDIANI